MRTLFLAAGGLVAVAVAGSLTDGDDGAFRDDFDSLDRERWTVSDGWANGEHQNCLWLADMASVADGTLRLALAPREADDRDYGCAEVQSSARHGYGTYEARIRFAKASGTTSTFFTHIGAPQDRPHNEIDFEYIGRGDGAMQTNYFASGDGGNEELHEIPGATEQFRTYAIVWEPERIRWFVDGELLREVASGPLPNEAQKIYFSIWSSDTLSAWLGPFEPIEEPVVMEVDWFAFTPLGADCPFEGSLACPS